MTKSTKKRSSKKSLLDEYLLKTQKEINESAIKTLKPINENADLISIDDTIHSTLLVLSADLLGGNHETAVGVAASYKITGITTKSIQCGEIPPINILDIGKAIPIVQNLFASIPLINSAIGSYIECIGKNMSAQCNETSFNYGVAMNIGANLVNSQKSPILRNIGINIGNIIQNIDKEENYKNTNELIKQLPNNKYRKRLSEYVKIIYTEKNTIDKTKSSLKKEEKETTKKPEVKVHTPETNTSGTLNIDVIGTKEDFEKAIQEISEKIPEISNTITFCTDDGDEIPKKKKESKPNQTPKKPISDKIKFATGENE